MSIFIINLKLTLKFACWFFSFLFPHLFATSYDSILVFGLLQRACVSNKAAARYACSQTQINDKDTFCGICTSDYCNGAPAQYVLTAVATVIPITIMKILSLWIAGVSVRFRQNKKTSSWLIIIKVTSKFSSSCRIFSKRNRK